MGPSTKISKKSTESMCDRITVPEPPYQSYGLCYGSEAKADINPQHDRHAKNIKFSPKSPKSIPNMPKRNALSGLPRLLKPWKSSSEYRVLKIIYTDN